LGGRILTTTYSDFTAAGQALGVTSQGTYTKTTLDTQGRVTMSVTKKTSDNSVIATVFTTYEQTTDGLITRRWGSNTYPTLTKQDLLGRTVELRTYRNIAASSLEAENLTLDASGGDKTTWNYDSTTGLLLSKRDSAEKGADYTYTADGKLLTRTWARTINSAALTATYDHTPGCQIKTVNYSDTTPDVTITYNRLGQRTSVSSLLSSVSQSSVSYSYDPATLALDKETITYTIPGQPVFTRILDRAAPSLGRPKGWDLIRTDQVGTPAVPTPVIENTAIYDYSATTGRLESVAGNSSGTFSYGYETNSSLIKTVTRPGLLETQPALKVTNTWEPTRNVLLTKANELVTKVSGNDVFTDVSSITYIVNELGQRKQATRTGATTNGTTWDYDALGQVISADDDSPAADRAYQYDTIGNRKKSANGLVLPSSDNWTANPLNQYSATPHATGVPVHDADGNLTEDRGGNKNSQDRQYVWDAENRLIAVNKVLTRATDGTIATTSPLVSYAYDALSRRIASTVADASSGGTIGTTCYVYDGWNVVAEYSISNSQYQLSKSYLWGLDLSGFMQGAGGVGGLLSLCIHDPQSTIYYPTYDGNGNISEYLEADGDVAAHFEYDPFGNTVVDTDNPTAPLFAYRFSTKPLDFTTGLYYYGYRWYDPITSRWPSRDPIGKKGGINLYGFIKNQPIQSIEVLGLWPRDIIENRIIHEQLNPPSVPTAAEVAAAQKICDGYPIPAPNCIRGGVSTADDYPIKAKEICKDFMKVFSNTKGGLGSAKQ
jgi:RHS repeat-associated protein